MKIAEMTVLLNEERQVYLSTKGYRGTLSKEALNQPQKVFEYMRENFQVQALPEEHVWMICTNIKGVPIGVFEVSHGTHNGSSFSPREVYRNALMANAVGIILVHNHPSGDPTPSHEDYIVTQKLNESGKLIGITFLDHMIVGDTYYSFRESMPNLFNEKA